MGIGNMGRHGMFLLSQRGNSHVRHGLCVDIKEGMSRLDKAMLAVLVAWMIGFMYLMFLVLELPS